MSRQTWIETLFADIANGSAITNTTTETILMPDITIPAFYMNSERALRLTLMGKLSTAASTPGNLTFKLRWGGVGGTILAQSSAIALATSITDGMFKIVLELICRGDGSSGSILAMGWLESLGFSSNIPNFIGSAGGASGNTPAAVTIDTTTNQNLSITAAFSAASASNSITGMNRILESLN